MKLPKHQSLFIEHNPHKSFYQSVQQYLDEFEITEDHISKEDRDMCIRRNELWRLQYYPLSPISFGLIFSYSLERCLELCDEELYDY